MLTFDNASCNDPDMKWIKNNPGPFVLAIAWALFAVLFMWVIVTLGQAKDERIAFDGACSVLGGTVHSDLCIKDGKVILTKKHFEEVSK